MAKYIKLTPAQKDEIRRLTQFANRRIKAAQKEYSRQGMDVLPREVVGDKQISEQWSTKSTPISRSVRFESMDDYKQQLRFLKSFERERPTVKQYQKVLRKKTLQAVDNTLGGIPTTIHDRLQGLTAPELDRFWRVFSDKASKLGTRYSSTQALLDTLNELYPEDAKQLENLEL